MRLAFLVIPLALALVPPLAAAPPKLDDVQAEYPDNPNVGVVFFTPKGIKEAKYVGLSGPQPFDVSQIGGSPLAFVLLTGNLREGRYQFVIVASNETGELAAKPFAVVKGTSPTPPNPPNPPQPPDPPPVTDPYVKALQAAYGNDPVPSGLTEKAAALKTLADLHGGMKKYCDDPQYQTAGQLAQIVHDSVVAKLGDRPDGKLVMVRTAIALEELKALPFSKSKALSADERVACAAFYARTSAALGQVRGVR